MKVRPHHLLCLLSATTKGYSPDFVNTFSDLKRRFESGEELILTNSADQLCDTCPFDQEGGLCISPNNQIAPDQMDERVRTALGLEYGQGITRERLIGKLKDLSRERIHSVCEGCTWRDGSSCMHDILAVVANTPLD
jgi:hypothetical protein